MVYRYSWLAGLAGLLFAFAELNSLLRPSAEGVPWQFVVVAAATLGIIIPWAAITYRLPMWAVIALDAAVLVVAVSRVASPDTDFFLIPTLESFSIMREQLALALTVIHTGIEPVLPLTGLVVVVMAVFWVAGTIMTWGLLRGHPYVGVIPPLVLTLQFATMDRAATGAVEAMLFVALVGLAVLAVALDERTQTAGRMVTRGAWSVRDPAPAPATWSLLAAGMLAAVVAVQAFAGSLPRDGIFSWRQPGGMTGSFFGSVSFNPFVSIQQSLVSRSPTPLFRARISGDLDPSQVYFQLVTMEAYTGGQFFASEPRVYPIDDRPYELPDAAFAGPTAEVTADIEILLLRQPNWVPSTYSVGDVSGADRLLRDLRIRRDDGSLSLEGGVTFEGMRYQITSQVPQPDLDVLASTSTGNLTRSFEFAKENADAGDFDPALVPTPVDADLVATTTRETPPAVERYLALPTSEGSRIDEIRALAFARTANLSSDFERAIALESWFHDPDVFRYKLLSEDELGHGATDLAAWLLDEDSPNFHQGYCENYATAMAVMARTLGIPSRVVLGFTPGELVDPDRNVVVVRQSNAHAWVELWMPSQGWVRFDPTPRGEGDTPQAFELVNAELGFDLTDYLDVPPSALVGFPFSPSDIIDRLRNLEGEGLLPGTDGQFPDGAGGGGIRLPDWLTAAALWIVLAVLVIGGPPALRWWRRRRRLERLRHGDITAAWEEIVGRLEDLGASVDGTATPREVADQVDPAMVPLASLYGRSVYGPPGSIGEHHVMAATRSFEDTCRVLHHRYPTTKRVMAIYRPSRVFKK
ncbi:MAG TPA: transglutaminaseTgpA domain-containing protein [Acidimicrobiia bacterium]|jgi:transglutaminase-like putative cysteine protease